MQKGIGGIIMLNSTTSVLTSSVDTYASSVTNQKDQKKEKASTTEQVAVVYEKSSDTSNKGTYSVTKMSAEQRSALVEQLKSDQQTRQQQLMDIAKQLMTKQGITYQDSIFSIETDDDSVWKFLASGEYTVDEAAKAQAQELISEDGYYGIKQTSERLFDFASALAGDDEELMQKMQKAIHNGYEEATKSWGKELPSICKDTIDATDKLFEEYYTSKSASVEE